MERRGSAIDATSAGNASCKVGFVHAYLGLGMSMLSLFDTAANADGMDGGRRFLCEKCFVLVAGANPSADAMPMIKKRKIGTARVMCMLLLLLLLLLFLWLLDEKKIMVIVFVGWQDNKQQEEVAACLGSHRIKKDTSSSTELIASTADGNVHLFIYYNNQSNQHDGTTVK